MITTFFLLFFQSILNLYPYVDMDKNSDSNMLILGVNQISSPGIPGNISVFGPDSFGIVQDKNGQIIVAGSTYEKGRIVLWGHDGFLKKSSIETGDTGQLLSNAIKWTTRKTAPKVGITNDLYLVNYLNNIGFDARLIEIESFTTVDLLIGGIEKTSTKQQIEIKNWLKRGGAIIDSATGWGWKQINPRKKLSDDFARNIFYAQAGLVFADGFSSDTTQDGFLVQQLPSSNTNAYFALDQLAERSSDELNIPIQEIKILSKTLTTAVNCIPAGDRIFRSRLKTILEPRLSESIPSPDRPITDEDILQRIAILERIRQSKSLPAEDVEAHLSAKTFPGIPQITAPLVKRSIEIDHSVPGWHSLGLFANAGQLIRVSLTPTSVKKKLKVRIGSTTCDLRNKPFWLRAPDIISEWPLKEQETKIASPFGGLIYIVVTNPKDEGTTIATIEGAIESPYYKLGETNLVDWIQRVRYLPAPRAEIASDKVVLTVPSAEIRALDDPKLLMQTWDKILDLSAELAVLPKSKGSPQRYCSDVQLCAGWMHAGNPIMIPSTTAQNLVDVNHLIREGDWGFYHETGHMFQNSDWTFEGTGEVTVNLFTMYILDKLCNIKPEFGRMSKPNVERQYRLYFKNGSQFKQWEKKPFLALYMYYQLQQEFGWESFKQVFVRYHSLLPNQRPKNDQEKRDQWMTNFSKIIDRNLGPFFELWGVPISKSAKNSVSTLPVWLPDNFPPTK